MIFAAPGRTPRAWYASTDFADASQPTAQATTAHPLDVPVSAPRRTSYTLTYPPGPASRVLTNVTAGPYLVHVDGAEEAGVASYQHMVLRLPASQSPRKVTFSARESAPLVAGQAISLLSLLGAVALVIWLAVRGRRGSSRRCVVTRIVEFCRRRVLWLIPIGVCLLLIAPMAFTQRTFSPDWTNHVWVVWQQKLNIQDLGLPELFRPERGARGLLSVLRLLRTPPLFASEDCSRCRWAPINTVVVLYFAAFLCRLLRLDLALDTGRPDGFAAYLPGCIAVTAPYVISHRIRAR